MKETITWMFVSGLLFVGFLVLLALGLLKKRKRTIMFSVLTAFFFVCAAGWTGYKFASKSYNKVSEALKPRTGQEIYKALFGKAQHGCVDVMNYQDQVVPKIDYAIWLEFETCPDELIRILSLHKYTTGKEATKGWETEGPSAQANWFKPETLGDTVLVFRYQKDEYGSNVQTIYSALDSTKAYCIDILD